MLILIPLVTVVFLLIAFVSTPPSSTSHPVIGYIQINISFIEKNLLLFITTVFLATILIVFLKKFDRSVKIVGRIIYGLTQVFQIITLGFLISFLSLFVLAFAELNILALIVNINPQILGIVNDRSEIVKRLKAYDKSPNILIAENDPSKILSSVAIASGGADKFFSKQILSSIPDAFVIPVKQTDSSLYLIDNTLIIARLNPEDLQFISPTVGYLLLKDYFWGREIKKDPNLKIMTKKEYINLRLKVEDKKVKIAASEINKIDENVSSLSAGLIVDADQISQNKDTIVKTYAEKNKQLGKCLSSGSRQDGKFVKYYTPEECNNSVKEFDEIVKNYNSEIGELTRKIERDNQQLENLQYLKSFYESRSKLLKSSSLNIPQELGVFNPDNSIRIVINNKSSSATVDFFETYLHEYLHFASYNPKKLFNSSFFEEGITEYFARNVIRNQFGVDTNFAYATQIKIIEELTKVIPENELADIYFAKDQARLESTLDSIYGDNFYSKNRILFDSLQYASTKNQILEIANKIMDLIDGRKLEEKDIYTVQSNL